MEAKFTKGEWAWQKFGDKYNLTAQHGMREIIISANINEEKSLQPYVSMNEDGILKPINPNNPNAKLIAVAPEMFEALQKCVKAFKTNLQKWQYKDEVLMLEALEKAENVIKKATE